MICFYKGSMGFWALGFQDLGFQDLGFTARFKA